MIALLLALASADPSALEAAYDKEYAYLAAERAALEGRLDAVRAEAQPRLESARAELVLLEREHSQARVTADALERRLADVQRASDEAAVASDAVDGTLRAAHSTLSAAGLTPPASEHREDAAASALSAGVQLVRRGATLRSEPGPFFLADGSEVHGERVYLGHVAAWGVSDEAAGALVPAGEGHWRLWPADAADDARALIDGTAPPLLNAYLYEDVAQRVDDPQEKTWRSVLEAGGVVGAVILALGGVAAILVVLRALTLLRLGGGSRRLLTGVTDCVRRGDDRAALALASGHSSALSTALTIALPHLRDPSDRRDAALEQALLTALPRLERYSTAILVIAAVAPLLGLLGTVTGMIATFDVLTRFGTGDPKMLSGGISAALVTTQLGLVVAIPAVLLGNLLSARGQRLADQTEAGLLAVLNAADEGPHTHPMQQAAK